MSQFRSLSMGVTITLVLSACADTPAYRVQSRPEPIPPPSTVVYFYPKSGQSPQQQDRDRYECYLWARQQSGYDPGQSRLAPHQRIEVTPATPPGTGAAVGAITGAVIGSAISRPRDSGEGALFGAVAGAIVGSAADASRQEQASQLQRHYDRETASRIAREERQASAYRRAMSACLEGRGYSVQ